MCVCVGSFSTSAWTPACTILNLLPSILSRCSLNHSQQNSMRACFMQIACGFNCLSQLFLFFHHVGRHDRTQHVAATKTTEHARSLSAAVFGHRNWPRPSPGGPSGAASARSAFAKVSVSGFGKRRVHECMQSRTDLASAPLKRGA